jgi:CheY-like chemotaxis protein
MPAHLIAVIDDDPPTTEMLSEVLTLEGYRVVICLSQVEAVSIIQQERPDLILLDLWLTTPTGGWTILEELARDPELATIPVIICTALPSTQIQPPPDLQSLPNVILHKPFELDHLFSIVNTALRG